MNLQTLQTRVAEIVRAIGLLASEPVFEEDKGNVLEQIDEAIARTHFCVVVGGASFTDEAPDCALCHGTAKIVLTVLEDPFLNRSSEGRPTGLVAAQAILCALKCAGDGDFTLTHGVLAAPVEGPNGVVSWQVSFDTTVTLTP